MRNAFVCCTPFHVFVSVHMAETLLKDQEKTIYISNHFNGAKNIYYNIKKMKVFNEVYFVTDKDLSYDTSLLKRKKIVGLIRRNHTKVIDIENINFRYDKIFIFTYSYFSVLLTDIVKKINDQTSVNFVEEGIMTYLLSSSGSRLRMLIDKAAKKVNRRFLNPSLVNNIYLFNPRLYAGDYNGKLVHIPEVSVNKNFKDNISNVFGYQPQEDFHNLDYVYFDQSFSIDNNKQINEREIVKHLLELFKDKSFVVKLHPRDSLEKYSDLITSNVTNSSFPWEVIFYNEDLTRSKLIAINSSAVFTPNTVFNKHNEIILLYKMIGLQDVTFDLFVKKFIQAGVKVHVPKDFSELSKLIKSFHAGDS